ncbi:ABC1 family-domain-containing protein [Trametes maxima]|nr:ABC1 family-domain-containing protein [Trametes maxima]
MAPGPAYNWLCVASSVCDILSHAAHIRAAQLSRAGQVVGRAELLSRKRKRDEAYLYDGFPTPLPETTPEESLPREKAYTKDVQNGSVPPAEPPLAPAEGQAPEVAITSDFREKTIRSFKEAPVIPRAAPPPEDPRPSIPSIPVIPVRPTVEEKSSLLRIARAPEAVASPVTYPQGSRSEPSEKTEVPPVQDVSLSSSILTRAEVAPLEPHRSRNLQSSKVPSSRIGRLFHYGGLAASLGYGAASELIRRTTSSEDNGSSSLMLTEGNVKRLVSKLTQMRGAALKLGQFMSIQDSHVLPPEIEDIFRRVQDSAHYMPDWQMEQVMKNAFGSSWTDNFESFNRLPFAAASIGQVHSAVLKAAVSPTGLSARVAVKVQFPNIVDSISSDLGYVKMLLTASKLLPRGLFLDRTIQVMKDELADECDYAREAGFARRFGQADHLGEDPRFKVPWVWEGSTDRVLVMEHVDGVSVGGHVIDGLSQQDRNDIAERIIDLCLRELFVFRVMQTDPNWTNFLWNPRTRKVELVDFGATREYSKEFIDDWLRLLSAAVADDRDACIEWSLKLGYLTGQENDIMLDAHVQSMVLLGTPFKAATPQPFTFGPGSAWTDITTQIRAQIPVMLQHRLTPPPRETYSLNRKLSGAFLLASRLGAEVDCRTLWTKVVDGYTFG